MSNNKNLMESILAHLRKLIMLTENGDEEKLEKLVNMANEVSNQIIRIENGELVNSTAYDSEESDDDPEDEDYEEN